MSNPFDHPQVRRDNETGTIVVRDGRAITREWLVVYRPPGTSAPRLEPAAVEAWDPYSQDRLADEQVGAWPFLNQCHHPDEWVQSKLDGHERARRAWNKEYGRLSAVIGSLRAELARARERYNAGQGGAL